MQNQRIAILNYINEFGSITSFEAYIDLGITQLASRIKELKEMGYPFKTEWIKKKNRYGKDIRFKKYMLKEEKEMDKIFYNSNGNTYYILFGGKGKKSFLCKINDNDCAQYVICAILEEHSWWQGNYFENFDKAYKSWKGV